MPDRVVIALDGATFVQTVSTENRERDLQAAVNQLLSLIEKERTSNG
jgi:carbamate kinase